MFLSFLIKEYQKRLEDLGFWALQEIHKSVAENDILNGDLKGTNPQVKLIYFLNMIKARKNIVEISDTVNNCINLRDYIKIAREYNSLINNHRLDILRIGSTPDRAWVNVMRLIEELDAMYQVLAAKISSEPDVITPPKDRPA